MEISSKFLLMKQFFTDSHSSDITPQAQQNHLSKKLMISLLLVLSLVQAFFISDSLFEWLKLAQYYNPYLYIIFLLSVMLAIGLYLSKTEHLISLFLKLTLLLPLVAILLVYQNGYLAITLAPLISLFVLIAWRGRFAMPLAYGFIACFGVVESLSPLQAGHPYVTRLLAVSAILVWPINTLLSYQSWKYKVRLKALTQLWISFIILTLPIAIFVASLQQVLMLAIIDSTIICFLWIISTRKNDIPMFVSRTYALTVIGLYFIALSIFGFLAAMLIPLTCLMLFLILPKNEAIFLALGSVLVCAYTYSSNAPTDFEPMDFFIRWSIVSLVFIAVINTLITDTDKKEHLDSQSLLTYPKYLRVSLNIIIALLMFTLAWANSSDLKTQVSSFPFLTDSESKQLTFNVFSILFATWVLSSFVLSLVKLRVQERSLVDALGKV